MSFLGSIAEITRLLRKLPPDAVDLVVGVVRAVATSKDPVDAARRTLEESLRVKGFDEAMKKIRP